ncbi:MAG: hypothetical protein JWQ35_227 [Bacteriovoracaceae bacterium]|nr:hypothetical protein [Bacteriovoracaceae bacterium]
MNKENNSTALRLTFENEMKAIETIYDSFPWSNKIAYGNWLAQTYYFVCHSTRLLATAAARFNFQQNKLHLRCIDHMKEERSHEILASQDLKHLGLSIDQFPELPVTSAFYQTQYFLIEHYNPLVLFGYILCLEGISSRRGKEACRQVVQSFGDKAAGFWKLHSEEDDGHLAQAFKQIDASTPSEVEAISRGLVQSSALYRQLLIEVASAAGVQVDTRSPALPKISAA